VSEFRSFSNGTSKGVLDVLETMYLKFGEIVVQSVTVVNTCGMYYGGCNDTGCFGINIRTDAEKITNMRIGRFRECRDLVRECETFVKNEAKVTSRVSGVKRRVTHFSKFVFKSDEKKISLRGVKSYSRPTCN